MNKKEAKEKIKILIEKYEKIQGSGKLRYYTEEDTKKDFILPLFRVLGWDVDDRNEVSSEESISSSGRVDYGFYLNNRIKFYLETKKLSADLNKEEYANQVIRYSFNTGVAWAVLTDFECLKVFNAQDVEKSLADKLFFEIPHTQYLERFEQLYLLSKESFEKDALDKEGEKYGKKLQKVSVTSLLYKDLQKCRDILIKELAVWNQNIDKDLLDEGVQKILDRLIFIRVAEDRGVEPDTLMPMFRKWQAGYIQGKKEQFYSSMVKKFRELDDIYNSDLFSEHPFEKWGDYGAATGKVISILYGKKGYYEYDFKVMPPDVLGAVYENYLAHRLSQSKKGVTIAKDAKKRKEQGIYYTPSFIVDYIVENALGPVLAKCKTMTDLMKIKVLDPACGSGSFLIKALEMISDKHKEFGAGNNPLRKYIILTQNIYGVDLDEQAVEITRLNLLVNALNKREKFPPLTNNIKNGNSLISGTDEELKKYFGKNFREKKPFNWQEEFPEAFKQGGFDVIIGNPPYGAELLGIEQDYFKEIYKIGSTDTAILFIKRSLEKLKEGGFLGFIIPKAFCFTSNYQKIRDFVWDNLFAIIDCGKVWREVKLEQVIVILEKRVRHKKYLSGFVENEQIKILGKIEKNISRQFGFFLNGVSSNEVKIAQKVLANSITLNDIAKNQRGAMLQKEIRDNGDTEVIGGAQLSRNGIKDIKGKIDRVLVTDNKAFIKSNSILVQRIIAHIENPIDHIKIIAIVPKNKNQIIVDTINQITITNKNYSPQFICTLLNSQFLNWYVYRFILGKAIRSMEFDNPTTSKLPIPKIDPQNKEKHDDLVKLADKMLKLNKELQEVPENSNKWNSIKSEIEKTDRKIDEEVYKLYGLTPEEIKIVENK